MNVLAQPDDSNVESLRAHYRAEDRPNPAAAIEELRLVLAQGRDTIRDLRLEVSRLRAEREVMKETEPTADELKALDDATGAEDSLLRALRGKLGIQREILGGGK